MIRIDEIYTEFFLPQVQDPARTSLHWFEPFGTTAWHNIQSQPAVSDLRIDSRRFLFWDQEPVSETTRDVAQRVRWSWLGEQHIVTSEWQSQQLQALCEELDFRSHYYWYHGWASLDWFRGYDRMPRIQPWSQRELGRTFMAPMRIIGGARQHRVILMNHLIELNLLHNAISFPLVCPVEGTGIHSVAQTLEAEYPGMAQRFDQIQLPMNFPGETGHPMVSYKLDLWDLINTSLVYLVTETVATGRRQHVTEKTLKPIAAGMPFVVVGCQGTLEYLKSYGFRTFDSIWPETYDHIESDHERYRAVAELMRDLDSMSSLERASMQRALADIVQHNLRHFYSGAFEQRLWQEMQHMLAEMAL